MSSRRVLPLVLLVTGLIAVAAIAAHGRPIGSSRGSGPTPVFFDYVFTSIAILAALVVLVFVYGLTGSKWSKPRPQRPRFGLRQLLVGFVVSLLLGWLLAHAHLHIRPHARQTPALQTQTTAGAHGSGHANAATRRGARLRWDEIAIVAALLAAAGVALYATRGTRPARDWKLRSHDEVVVAVDESLDDLRREPDVRRAIIAAYARMEQALAAAGIPRRPSEAPLEYLARALQSLHASAAAITTLTDLFERAKFSRHELGEPARNEAIAALVAVRDEVRAAAVEEAA